MYYSPDIISVQKVVEIWWTNHVTWRDEIHTDFYSVSLNESGHVQYLAVNGVAIIQRIIRKYSECKVPADWIEWVQWLSV